MGVVAGDQNELLAAFPQMLANAATLSPLAITTLTINLTGITHKLTGGKLPGSTSRAPGGKLKKTSEQAHIYLSLIQVRSLHLFFYLLSFPTLSSSSTP